MHHVASVDERGSDTEQLAEEDAEDLAVNGRVMQCDAVDDSIVRGQLLLLPSPPDSQQHSVVS